MDVAGGTARKTIAGQAIPPAPGKSLRPVFEKDGTIERDSLWWLHEGNRALRVGHWKIVAAGQKSPWELYDLSIDRSESKNLAGEFPEKVRLFAARWEKQRDEYIAQALKDAPPGAKVNPK